MIAAAPVSQPVDVSPPALELRGVSKRFGGVAAVRDVSLTLPAGGILALLGPSGCGKTTTLRLVAGFVHPDAGQVRVGGHDVTHLPPHLRQLGMVFQNYALFPHMTVAQNVAFGLRMHGVPPAEIGPRVEAALALVQMREMDSRFSRMLSGGQQQRVALARAIVTRPRLLLLDEPFGALDRKLREEMQIELRQLQRTVGISFVFVTHDQDEALTISDQIAVMRDGRVEQVGRPAEVYERPASLFVASFFGALNAFDVRVVGRNGDETVVESPAGRWCLRGRRAVGDRSTVAVRASDMRVGLGEPETDGGRSLSLAARVEEVVYKGASLLYRLRASDGTPVLVSAGGAGSRHAAPGTDVRVTWDEDRTHLFPAD